MRVLENGSVNNILALNNLLSPSDALKEGEIELNNLKDTTHKINVSDLFICLTLFSCY